MMARAELVFCAKMPFSTSELLLATTNAAGPLLSSRRGSLKFQTWFGENCETLMPRMVK